MRRFIVCDKVYTQCQTRDKEDDSEQGNTPAAAVSHSSNSPHIDDCQFYSRQVAGIQNITFSKKEHCLTNFSFESFPL